MRCPASDIPVDTHRSVTSSGRPVDARRAPDRDAGDMTSTLTPSTALRPVLVLLATFAAVSLAMIAVLIVQSATGADVATAIWVRCSLVLASAVVMLLIARSAARGSRGAFVRIRIISAVVVAAVIVIVAIPGFLPGWVRIEQALCGLLVLPAAILLNRPSLRRLYPKGA